MAMFLPILDKPEQRKTALYTSSWVHILMFRDLLQQSKTNNRTIIRPLTIPATAFGKLTIITVENLAIIRP
jgi:hypothetical protein